MDTTLPQLVRIRLDISYDGSHFHGWAAQPGLRTVEGQVQQAIERVVRKQVILTCAGRTDAGVHARGQVAHFDIPYDVCEKTGISPDPSVFVRRVNSILTWESSPKGASDVRLVCAQVVDGDFDARFSALGRHYSYRICDNPDYFEPLHRGFVLWNARALDVDAMNEAAKGLIGEHDFLSFCKPREGASTIRTLRELCVRRERHECVVYAHADAFCHSMVRTLVGSLLRVGEGRKPVQWPAQRLAERSRQGEIYIAPAHPLVLEKVDYPEPRLWAVQAEKAKVYRCEC